MSFMQRVQQCSGAVVGLLSLAALAGAAIPQTQGNAPAAGKFSTSVPRAEPTSDGAVVRTLQVAPQLQPRSDGLPASHTPAGGSQSTSALGGFCAGSCSAVITQGPDQVTGYFSDSDCALCGGAQVLAEDFILSSTKNVCEIVFWGGYYPSDSAPADSFYIAIHSDSGSGSPGATIYTETGVAPARFQTGNFFAGVHEWQYSWVPSSTVTLTPGQYWVEIFNNVPGGDEWAWITGTQDGSAGGPNVAFDIQAPGVNWNIFAAALSMVVCGEDQGGGGSKCADDCPEQANQAPNQAYGYYSDAIWDAGGGTGVSEADDFTLAATKTICNISWYGFYLPDSSPADSFNVLIHADAGGIPGAVVYSEAGVVPSKHTTGLIVQGQAAEWQYDWVPSGTVTLAAGTYWLEVFNAVSPEDWAWEVSSVGNFNSYYAFEAPGVTWNFAGDNLAFVVCGQDEVTQGCVSGFVGDTTISGGWDAFETLVGKDMEVLASGVPDFTQVTDIAWSRPGTLNLNPAHLKLTVGASWGSWSHGYMGEVFWTQGATSATLTMPNAGHQVSAFDCYIEPNPFSVNTFTVTGTAFNGDTTTFQVTADGSGGANHFGVYATDGCCLQSVTISGPVDWAIGELRLGQCKPGCEVGPNSSGNPALMSFSGSLSIATNNFTVNAFELPHNQFYIFFHGPNQTELPFGNGSLCIAAPQTRLTPPVKASATGLASRLVDISGFPVGDMSFQCWFRDPPAGGAFFDLSDRLKVTFVP